MFHSIKHVPHDSVKLKTHTTYSQTSILRVGRVSGWGYQILRNNRASVKVQVLNSVPKPGPEFEHQENNSESYDDC